MRYAYKFGSRALAQRIDSHPLPLFPTINHISYKL